MVMKRYRNYYLRVHNWLRSLIFWTVNTFRKRVVTTTPRYHSAQSKFISGNAYWIDPEGTVPFTLAIGSIRIGLDRTSLVVPSGSIWIDSGRVYTACWIEPIRSGSIQKPSVNGLLVRDGAGFKWSPVHKVQEQLHEETKQRSAKSLQTTSPCYSVANSTS